MANRRNTTNTTNNRNRTQGTKKTNSSNTNNRTRTNSKPTSTQGNVSTGFGDWLHAFSKTRVFKPIISILAVIVILALDLLFSWNSFNIFYILVAIELILFVAIWCIKLMLDMTDKENEEANNK